VGADRVRAARPNGGRLMAAERTAPLPTVEEKAGTLVAGVELVGRNVAQGIAVWWVPSWSAPADALHMVALLGQAVHGDCEHGQYHMRKAGCSHAVAVRMYLERRQ
jgi:hypothetical protein